MLPVHSKDEEDSPIPFYCAASGCVIKPGKALFYKGYLYHADEIHPAADSGIQIYEQGQLVEDLRAAKFDQFTNALLKRVIEAPIIDFGLSREGEQAKAEEVPNQPTLEEVKEAKVALEKIKQTVFDKLYTCPIALIFPFKRSTLLATSGHMIDNETLARSLQAQGVQDQDPTNHQPLTDADRFHHVIHQRLLDYIERFPKLRKIDLREVYANWQPGRFPLEQERNDGQISWVPLHYRFFNYCLGTNYHYIYKNQIELEKGKIRQWQWLLGINVVILSLFTFPLAWFAATSLVAGLSAVCLAFAFMIPIIYTYWHNFRRLFTIDILNVIRDNEESLFNQYTSMLDNMTPCVFVIMMFYFLMFGYLNTVTFFMSFISMGIGADSLSMIVGANLTWMRVFSIIPTTFVMFYSLKLIIQFSKMLMQVGQIALFFKRLFPGLCQGKLIAKEWIKAICFLSVIALITTLSLAGSGYLIYDLLMYSASMDWVAYGVIIFSQCPLIFVGLFKTIKQMQYVFYQSVAAEDNHPVLLGRMLMRICAATVIGLACLHWFSPIMALSLACTIFTFTAHASDPVPEMDGTQKIDAEAPLTIKFSSEGNGGEMIELRPAAERAQYPNPKQPPFSQLLSKVGKFAEHAHEGTISDGQQTPPHSEGLSSEGYVLNLQSA